MASAGAIPNVPETPAAYAVVCRLPGETERALGEILLLGVTPNLRRRTAALLGSHAGLHAHQAAGGQADLVYVALDKTEGSLEAALIQEHMHRAGTRPAWNRTVPKTRPSPAATKLAESILDALNVRPR